MISVIIPLYNKAQSIGKTIRCVLEQTFQDFEIVIVEGYSSDNSEEVVRSIADKRIRIQMQKVKRGGVTAARNEGIAAAQYEYIAFLDADDYWEPNYLEEVYKLIQDFPKAGIWGVGYAMFQDNQTITKSHLLPQLPLQFRGIINNTWSTYGCPYWTGCTTTSKKALNKVGAFDENIIYGEDLDLWYRLMLNFPAAFYNVTLAYYHLDAENRAMNKPIPFQIHLPFFIEKYAEYRKKNADFRQYFDKMCLYRLFPYALENKNNPELKRVLKQIDFSQQKISMRLRFIFPKLYNKYLNRLK